ncbi:hypothetical protein SAMN05192533_104277 [Mesobacillus persicus]|uniref:Uncharacterized protein n=1 Tax=Mesobacillus persicus TaxID=930146 RepID=A0A1H8A7D8_9BACI|nr:hypothetical protein SAMN05192533_104277 [Mesobacillus persicus]
MKKKVQELNGKNLFFNAIIIASVLIALTSGYRLI